MTTSDTHVAVDSTNGGRLSSINVGGHELLVQAEPDPLAWGAYPMVPFAGRVREGLLDFDGRAHQLPQTMGHHAIHGYGFVSPWSRVDATVIEHHFAEPWPYRGLARQSYELTDDALTVTMTIEAIDRQPVCIGWHPWFLRNIGNGSALELEFDAEWMYEIDDEIPTGRRVPMPDGPWDNCFTGVRSAPRLHWGALTVEVTSTLDHWVVYDMPEHALCVEPQSGPPNEINSNPRVVDANSSFEASMTLSFC